MSGHLQDLLVYMFFEPFKCLVIIINPSILSIYFKSGNQAYKDKDNAVLYALNVCYDQVSK